MPAQTSEQHVASIDIKVDGSSLDPTLRNLVLEVKVVDSLKLPSMATIRLSDPQGTNVDSHPMQIGSKLEVKAGATGDRSTSTIFKGQVAAVEPEFGATGVTITVRAYDMAHTLNRERKTRTFQEMKASDMVTKIASDAGLQPDVETTNFVHEFFQQSNETDWDFAWRLALMHDFEVRVDDEKLVFRKANVASGAPIELRWQEKLISFRPRITGVQQFSTVNVRGWDPKAKKAIESSASSAQTTSQPGVGRATVASALGNGRTAVADRVITADAEAKAIAESTLNRTADAFYEADGVAFGNPKIKAGVKVKIQGVGAKYGGTFTVTTATHTYRGSTGYQTAFQISGRSTRTLLELIRQPQPRDWSANLVVGVVTNNNDPEAWGRVRVKYPSLSDSEESAWARIATPSAGNARGLLMLPQPGEEVIVGFEHGDARRPIVVGSVFNGKDKPGDGLVQERKGAFAVLSDDKIVQKAKEDIEISTEKGLIIEVKQDETVTVKGASSHETTRGATVKAESYAIEATASNVTIKAKANVTVEATASLTLKGATIDIQGSGPVNIKGAIINLG
jgi:phage protein D/phage baseplate assembly protein gpV